MQTTEATDEHVEVARAIEELIVWLRQARDLSGVSASALSVLTRLRDAGAVRVTELALREGLTQPGMTTLINRLEKEGLATRRSDPLDGRAVLVAITDDGRGVVRDREAARAVLVARGVDRLSAADRAALLAALPALQNLTAPELEKEAAAS